MTAAAAEGVLWLVRHGHTVVHDSGGIAGRSDVALSADGRAAVQRLGVSSTATARARARAARWFASPLERTRDSAAILQESLDHGAIGSAGPIAIERRLVELDFGDWEGSTWAAVHRDDGAALASWGEHWVTGAPPNGESFAGQAARCGEWFDEQAGAAPPGGTARARDALVVTHGGSIRALACRLLGWPLGEAMRLAVDPGAAFRFERDARGKAGWRLAGANLGDLG